MTDDIIVTQALTKRFPPDIVAVDGLDLNVHAGEIFGLLGPNGAGKSTTIGMLTTRVTPTSGRAEVGGVDVIGRPAIAKQVIGVVPQTNTLDRAMTVFENLEFHGRYFGMSKSDARREARSFLERVRLADRASAPVMALSGGMAQRLMVARAIMHRPQVLFLDEPTAGLDPQSRRAIWTMLENMTGTNPDLSVVLTTHAMDEADHLCDRVAIMDRGHILCEDSPEALKRGLATGERVEIETDRAIAEADRDAIVALGAVNWRSLVPETAQFEARPGEGIGRRAAGFLEEKGYRVLHLTIAPVSLEDVFFSYTGHALREA